MTRVELIRLSGVVGALVLAGLVCACGDGGGGGSSTDSGSHWLRPCEADADCLGLACVCGLCTSGCDDDAACASLEGVCRAPAGVGGADCSEATEPPAGLCTAECATASDCPGGGDGFRCDGGLCVAEVEVATPCASEGACGPAPGMPNGLCDDGETVSGPTGRCLEGPGGTCGWEIVECPPGGGPATCESCPGPAPGMPNILCDDGETVGGPVCQPDEGGTCLWQIVDCP